MAETNTNITPEIKDYFQSIEKDVDRCYTFANEIRKKGLDPEDKVDIPLAKNMAERVTNLISIAATQLADKKVNTKITQRIQELEKKYSLLDWRVALKIAEEVAKEKFCKFESKLEAMEVGIRMGFAYLTLGIVSAPLEGFIGLKIKKRKDGKEYFSLQYAGPVRGAGGTGAAVSSIIGDYIRVKMGYHKYDPDEREINRWASETHDYHDRVTNLQYHPSDEEIKFLAGHIPVEIGGDPTEKFEVSNYKDLPRIETNRIRGGFCLVLAEGLAQKAPKIWKKLSQWGKEFDLEWDFLEEFLNIQKKIKASAGKKNLSSEEKISPNYTYISDLVAGRPILTYPLAAGGFRLRYGRTRVSGFTAAALNPATQYLLNKYIAIGTQLKLERPSKGATVSICTSIEGPIVRLKDQSVIQINSVSRAKELSSEIEKILFLGDILSDYGDFSEFGHVLVPAGYCPEWWIQELEKAVVDTFGNLDLNKLSKLIDLDVSRLKELFTNPLIVFPTATETLKLSWEMNIPLHPVYTYHWKIINKEDLLLLKEWLLQGSFKKDLHKFLKIILPLNNKTKKVKKCLEDIGIPHLVVNKESVVIEAKESTVLANCFNFENQEDLKNLDLASFPDTNALEIINQISKIKIRDKSGTFIGARMGRPEKAKQRKMTGSPHVMFPVGREGDRLRSFQSALKAGKIRSDFPFFFCPQCQKETIYSICENCDKKTVQRYFCRFCGPLNEKKCKHGNASKYKTQDLNINHYFTSALKKLQIRIFPDLIKGVRGTSSKNHIPEHLAKGILRAKNNIYVNTDGTTRYDSTEQPITHFKPKEINTPPEKLKNLGYQKDIYGEELVEENQVLELKPQDVILPGHNSLEDSAQQVLFQVAQFIDELLVRFYCAKPFYNLESPKDLIGQLIVGLAPHTSAGLVGRIIGFSQTQSFLAHPLYHAGMRRDCLTHDQFIHVFDGKYWQNIKIGNFVESFNPQEKIDKFGTLGKKTKKYFTLSYNKERRKTELSSIKEVTKHLPRKTIKVYVENGREIETTEDHVFYVKEKERIIEKKANKLTINELLIVPNNLDCVKSKKITEIFIPEIYSNKDLMVSGVNEFLKKKINSQRLQFYKKYNIKRHNLNNYLFRKNWPADLVKEILGVIPKIAQVSIKRDNVKIPSVIKLDKDVLWLIGLYIAEGFSRKNISSKSYYQVSFAATENFIRRRIEFTCKKYFNLMPSRKTENALIYSGKLFYLFFTDFLNCGSSAHEKRIPYQLLNLKLNRIKYLLQGYFDGDGSTDKKELRVTCDTVSNQLIGDLYFILSRYGIYFRRYQSTRKPGKPLQNFYFKKGREIPLFTITKLTILSNYCQTFAEEIGFSLPRKQKVLLNNIKKRRIRGTKVKFDGDFTYLKIISVEKVQGKKPTYCLNVDKNNNFIANNFIVHNCDGDEAAVMLLMDAFINFSRQYLPESRGGKTMDAPLVLTILLNPSEVDDQVHGLGTAWKYPLEFYQAALEYKNPWDIKIDQLKDHLEKPSQYHNFGFTHTVENFNHGVQCSAYKTLPTMEEKLKGQMDIAQKVRAVDKGDVAKLVIEKHFLKDIRGNLRKFSSQQFRCTKCNEKYRRPPLTSRCSKCHTNLIFTISEGSIVKYLEHSLNLAKEYDFSPYLKQSLEIVQENIHLIFGKEKEKQVGLGDFIGKK